MRNDAGIWRIVLVLAFVGTASTNPRPLAVQATSPSFTVDQILGLPSPTNLIASPAGSTIAWTYNERGARNVYVASAPGYEPRRITEYLDDDGQELTHLTFSTDGSALVYVRGGDHGSNRPGDAAPNPSGGPIEPKMQIWSVPVAGGPPKLLGDGDGPVIAPDSGRVAFVRDRRIWIARIDGSKPAEPAFFARGSSGSPAWSPDGRTLAFVLNRSDHSFIGLFTPNRPLRYLAPSTSRDSLPTWSPDGRKIAFVRQPGIGAPRSPLVRNRLPWAIMVADPNAPDRAVAAVTSGDPIDPILEDPAGLNLSWAADDHLIFLSYRDGWAHLYSIKHPTERSRPMLLTPGSFMVEQVTLTPDRRFVIYNANTGPDRADNDRRHLFKVPVDAATPVPLTTGSGIEWNPVVTSDGQTVACLTSDAKRPPLPALVPLAGGSTRIVGRDRLPSDFPVAQLVTPEQVVFRASDGVEAHGQLFKPGAGDTRKPAVVYVHGGGGRGRCCSAGTIGGNTRTTTAPINILRAAASSCSR